DYKPYYAIACRLMRPSRARLASPGRRSSGGNDDGSDYSRGAGTARGAADSRQDRLIPAPAGAEAGTAAGARASEAHDGAARRGGEEGKGIVRASEGPARARQVRGSHPGKPALVGATPPALPQGEVPAGARRPGPEHQPARRAL